MRIELPKRKLTKKEVKEIYNKGKPLTEKQEETCQNCGQRKDQHIRQILYFDRDEHGRICKKFVGKTSLGKKPKEETEMYCVIEGCGNIDETYTAHCFEHGRSPHKIRTKAKNQEYTTKDFLRDTKGIMSEGTFDLNKHFYKTNIGLAVHKNYVKEFIKVIEKIITRRCMGTSANCYEIKKEIKERAGFGEDLR